jgi:hypothetical protein
MKDELYKKIYIQSKSDLPKEEGLYFIGIKNVSDNTFDKHNLYPWHKQRNKEVDEFQIRYWLTSFDWYLQPLESQPDNQGGVTDQDIENFALKNWRKVADTTWMNAIKFGAKALRDNKIEHK